MAIQVLLNGLLDQYLTAKKEAFAGHPIRASLKQLEQEFRQLDETSKNPNLTIDASRGQGNWANVPWIALMDSRETSTTQEGVYVVYLFRADMTGVYLTLNQGVTKVKKEFKGSQNALKELAQRAEGLRAFCAGLPTAGFALDGEIDLATDKGLGRDYEAATVAHKFYSRGKVPSDDTLRADLKAALHAYDGYLQSRPIQTVLRTTSPSASAILPMDALSANLRGRGLQIPEAVALAALTGLSCQPITLLAGPAGTGKTQLALALFDQPGFAGRTVEVEGGWTDSASAFGYVSPTTQDFVPGPILLRLLELLQSKVENPLLLLDEINVSPPHVYLAPLLSALERAFAEDRTVPLLVAQSGLSPETRKALEGAAEANPGLRTTSAGPFVQLLIDIPPSLRILGTLNFDASTEDLAPKLLSRSFVVWFENPSISSPLVLKPTSSYNLQPFENPQERLGEALADTMARGLGGSARAVRRAERAFAGARGGGKNLVDILLSGLVLPHIQTMTAEAGAVALDEAFLDALPPGLFQETLRKMRTQLTSTGMANLWLIA